MEQTELSNDAADLSRRFGALVRRRRQALGLSLEDLATVAGVGIRFIHELEHGKPTCQIGRSFVVAGLVGLTPVDLLELETGNIQDPPTDRPDR
jgi:ribosome-binding protein aMBF1 (putative translation factor)